MPLLIKGKQMFGGLDEDTIVEGVAVLIVTWFPSAVLAWAMFRRQKNWRHASYAFGVLSGLFSFAGSKGWETRPLSASELARFAANQNRTLPRMVNADIESQHVSVSDGLLVFEYRVVNYDPSSNYQVDDAARAKMVAAICKAPGSGEWLLRHHVAIRVLYTDKAGTTLLTSVDVHPSDCGFH